MVGWWSACQLGWLNGARDVWLVSWLVVEDGEAGGQAVCLVGRLVDKLSTWMVDWCCGCLGGRAVSLDGEAVREAVSLDGWLVVEDGRACREAVSLGGRSG